MNIYGYAPLIITGFISLAFLVTILIVMHQTKKSKEIDKSFILQLEKASGVSDEEYKKQRAKQMTGKNPLAIWNNYWGNRFRNAGVIPLDHPNEKVGTLLLVSILTVYFMGFLVSGNIGIGLLPVIAILVIVPAYLDFKVNQRKEIFEAQIPPFLATLKANVQANETPERALINAINQVNDPLYSELLIAKTMTEASTFKAGITELRKRTTNDNLKFLCSCIELSTQVGSNLEEQIIVIEKMLEVKRSLNSKLQLAVKENTPLVYAASALIPALFIYMYLTSEITREFWFKSLLSWVLFGAIIVIFLGALKLTKFIIKKVSDF